MNADMNNVVIYKNTRPIHVKCGSIHEGHLSISCAPEARANPNPDGKFCLELCPEDACPRALPKGRPRIEMPPCKAQEKWISTQSVDLGRSVRPFRPGGGFLPLTPSAGHLFCKSSRASFESVKPNRFSGLADRKPRTAGWVSPGLYLG